MAFDKSQSKLYVIRKLLLQNKTYYLKKHCFFSKMDLLSNLCQRFPSNLCFIFNIPLQTSTTNDINKKNRPKHYINSTNITVIINPTIMNNTTLHTSPS